VAANAAAQTANLAAALQRSTAIMNAVASPISANSANSGRKIRRKTDAKVNLVGFARGSPSCGISRPALLSTKLLELFKKEIDFKFE